MEKEAPARPPAEKELPAIAGLCQGRAEKLDQRLGPGEWVLVLLSYLVLILTFPVSVWMCLEIVNEFEQAVILRLGHMWKAGAVRPGVCFVLPCVDILIRVDMRTKFLDLPVQEVLTKDPLSLDIDSAIYYRIQNPVLVVRNVADPDSAALLLTQTALGNVLGTKYLSQIICNRDKIAQSIQSVVDSTISPWGITLEHLEIRNVKTKVKPEARAGGSPTPPRRAELKKEGPAEEEEAPRRVKEASLTITETPTSLRLHCMQKETTGGRWSQRTHRAAPSPPLGDGEDAGDEGPAPVGE